MNANTSLTVKARLFHCETGRWPSFVDAEPQEEPGEYLAWIKFGTGRAVQITLLVIEALENARLPHAAEEDKA